MTLFYLHFNLLDNFIFLPLMVTFISMPNKAMDNYRCVVYEFEGQLHESAIQICHILVICTSLYNTHKHMNNL